MRDDIDAAVEEYDASSEQRATERIRRLCLERCDDMTCGSYDFPERCSRTDWLGLVIVTIVTGVVAWVGSLF